MVADESHDDSTNTHIVLTKGIMVSHYRIIEKIGAGGMGEVYLAEDTDLDRKVALKFLPPHLCRDEDCRKRFKREAQAAAKLSHPNIVTIHEVGEHQTRPYFVMEHVEGRSLRDVKAEVLDIDRIVGIAIQLCDGLHSAHTAGVTHRDIKRSNIIIDSSGRPRLLDFGLATVKGGEHLTKTGSTLGTVGYMSPEQIEGKATDARSDLFSLGVLLYELIANKSPFRRNNETATLKAVLNDTPEPLARYKSDVPDDLQRIITKLLEKDPALRYQSAAGVIPDLKKMSAASATGVEIERMRGRWNRYVLPSAVIILLAVAAIWYFGYRDREPGTTDSHDRVILAVLPFENLGDPEYEYFADGITNEIGGKLGRLSQLGVISRTTSIRYKKTDKTLVQIGKELGVDYILEGTIRWVRRDQEKHIRVQPQLISIVDDTQVWSEEYNIVMEDVLSVQSEIAQSVVRALNLSLLAPEREVLSRVADVDPEAYELYLKGKDYRGYDFDRIQSAVRYLNQAIERDSAFAPAYAALSIATADLFRVYGRQYSGPADQMREYALRAIELDSTVADGYEALAYYLLWVESDPEQAMYYLQIASEREPDNSGVLASLGTLMFMEGNLEASVRFRQRALSLDPAVPQGGLATSLKWLRRWDELIAYCDHVLKFMPGDMKFQFYRAEAIGDKYLSIDSIKAHLPAPSDSLAADRYLFQVAVDMIGTIGNHTEQINLCEKRLAYCQTGSDSADVYLFLSAAYYGFVDSLMLEFADSAVVGFSGLLEGDSLSSFMAPMAKVFLAAAHAIKGDALIADSLCGEVLAEAPLSDRRSMTTVLNMCAVVYAQTGQHERAIEILEQMMSRPSDICLFDLLFERFYDPLRDHPRFQALIEKYEKEQGI